MARIRNRFRAKMTWIVLLATGLMVATGLAQEPCTNMFPNSNHCTDCQQIEPGGAPAYKCTTQAFFFIVLRSSYRWNNTVVLRGNRMELRGNEARICKRLGL